MNANDLANELENDIHWIEDELARQWVVDMLRQQEVEIESLKATVARLTIEGGKEIKPVKYSAEWWKEVEEFNKQLRAHKK